MPFQLRDYQQSLIDRCFHSLDQSETPLLVAPTGAGKTIIAAEIVQRLIDDGQRVLVTAQRIKIIHQFIASIKAHTEIEPGLLIAGGKAAFEDHRFVVAMVLTIVRRLDSLPAGWCLLEDECQHSLEKAIPNICD